MIGSRLKQLREKAGLTQNELGQKLSLTRDTISRYERNIIFPPDEVKVLICKLFDVSMDYLYGISDVTGCSRQARQRLEQLLKGKYVEDWSREPRDYQEDAAWGSSAGSADQGNESERDYLGVSKDGWEYLDGGEAGCEYPGNVELIKEQTTEYGQNIGQEHVRPDAKISEMTFEQLKITLEPYLLELVLKVLDLQREGHREEESKREDWESEES